MASRSNRGACICHLLGRLLIITAGILLFPILVVLVYWGRDGDGIQTLTAFALSAGNATDIDVLKEAGVGKCDMAVGATWSDADNLVFAILAKSLGVPNVIVRMSSPDYEEAYRLAGVSAIVRVTDLMINQIARVEDIKQAVEFLTAES